MAVSRVEVGSFVVAAVAVVVSIGIAVHQSNQTREALFESRVQSRVASCVSLGALYASQSWAYGALNQDEYERQYGVLPDSSYDSAGPNLMLEEFSHKSIATGRALQICLAEAEDTYALERCIATTVDGIDAHMVDDSNPLDGTVDNLIC